MTGLERVKFVGTTPRSPWHLAVHVARSAADRGPRTPSPPRVIGDLTARERPVYRGRSRRSRTWREPRQTGPARTARGPCRRLLSVLTKTHLRRVQISAVIITMPAKMTYK